MLTIEDRALRRAIKSARARPESAWASWQSSGIKWFTRRNCLPTETEQQQAASVFASQSGAYHETSNPYNARRRAFIEGIKAVNL